VTSLPNIGRRVGLGPVTAELERLLYNSVVVGDLPWQWYGYPTSTQGFHESLWSRSLVAYSILSLESATPLGLASAYGANLANGTCYMQVLLFPEYQRRFWPLEGAVLLINTIFNRFNLRKIYGEVSDKALRQFASALRRSYIHVEGTLREHGFVDGQFQDVHIMAVYREEWALSPFGRRTSSERPGLVLGSEVAAIDG